MTTLQWMLVWAALAALAAGILLLRDRVRMLFIKPPNRRTKRFAETRAEATPLGAFIRTDHLEWSGTVNAIPITTHGTANPPDDECAASIHHIIQNHRQLIDQSRPTIEAAQIDPEINFQLQAIAWWTPTQFTLILKPDSDHEATISVRFMANQPQEAWFDH